jgi:hypothetical protein
MKHRLHSCNRENCYICEGGLALCTVCGGAEASLPTDCPGKPMGDNIENAVMAGIIDFIDGKWICKIGENK